MDIIRSRSIIRSLADGVDPTTGAMLSEESVFNKPEVIRALYTIWEATTPKPVQPLAPPQNAGKPWAELEDDKLREEFAEKIKIADIAKEHGRTYGAIESRLNYLGFNKKPFWLFRRKN